MPWSVSFKSPEWSLIMMTRLYAWMAFGEATNLLYLENIHSRHTWILVDCLLCLNLFVELQGIVYKWSKNLRYSANDKSIIGKIMNIQPLHFCLHLFCVNFTVTHFFIFKHELVSSWNNRSFLCDSVRVRTLRLIQNKN